MMGIGGYVLAIIVLTPGYQLFQAANNTGTLMSIPIEQQGTVSGLLNLSRNTGAILGAAGLGAIFATGVGTAELAQASGAAIAMGMQFTFLVAGGMMICAIVVARISGRT
jgi:hypothetical protein